MGRTIRNEQPDGWNGSHLLECTHSLNSRSRIDYLMYCNVLKTMSDGRLKVYVYGTRYHSIKGGRIRYVNDWQVSPAEKWGVKKHEENIDIDNITLCFLPNISDCRCSIPSIRCIS